LPQFEEFGLRLDWKISVLGLVAGICLAAGAASLGAQSGAPAGQSPSKPDTAKPDAPKGDNDNPFPGESTNAPIIAVDPPPAPKRDVPNARQMEDGGAAPRGDADAEADPVRSPDDAAAAAGNMDDDGFSSSRSGLKNLPVEDDSEQVPGKSTKVKTRLQVVKEDVDVGNFYLEKKNWKAAQGRFGAAFALDPENPDAVFGMAEAERHLDMFKEAEEHYKLFLAYDPEGPHGRAARKGLDQVEAAKASGAGRASGPGPDVAPHP
jgi:tetratricopeptide (TPR) repeat protein